MRALPAEGAGTPTVPAPPRFDPGLLLRTKLVPPAARPELVPRAELVARLAAATERKLTLLSAPAGSGKTSLLAAWLRSDEHGRPFAWLSLDPADNDPVRFWTYAIEALRTVSPGFGATALALLRAPGTTPAGDVVPALLDEALTLAGQTVLVLDDYHAVESQEVHRSVELLLDHLPATLLLVVATRSDPPLPLARLRARAELLELRAEQLRFSAEEAAAFLNEALGLGLTTGDVARLHERTEGWAAGLYLAALSLRGRDAHAFIEDFAGDDRHVVDYLVGEVIDRQPDELRTFLLRTSVLERLCGPLCDAVLETDGSAGVLERLESSNLFLVPLDSRREWYRYHHLFGQLLRHTLARAEPGLVPALHRRASAWHREAGHTADAIEHALAAGETEEAAELLAVHWSPFVQAGLHGTVERWFGALPEEAVLADARLCVARAWTLVSLGRKQDAVRWVEAIERAPLPGPFTDGTTSPASAAALLRAVYLGLEAGDVAAAAAAYRTAAELESESSPWRTVVGCGLGDALAWLGEADDSERVLRETVPRARATAMHTTEVYALGRLALMAAERGAWDESEDLAAEAGRVSSEYGVTEHWVAAMGHLAAAKALVRQGRLGDAEPVFERALELARRGSGPLDQLHVLVELAAARRAGGDRIGARDVVAEARRVLDRCADPGPLASALLERAEKAVRAAPPRIVSPLDDLSEREFAVLRLLATPRSLREIASALYVSQNTVKTHTRAIYRKLAVSGRVDAVARARELRLL